MPTIVLVVLTKRLGAWHPEPQQLATPQPTSLTRAWVLTLTSPAGRFHPLLYSCPSYCYMTQLPPFCLPYIPSLPLGQKSAMLCCVVDDKGWAKVGSGEFLHKGIISL